uniref:Uncharacterized protein n=1 Tax=Arundo donax TaxID=35708 RepID=A0A0A9CLG6_ARUDO
MVPKPIVTLYNNVMASMHARWHKPT